jgi:excisionase family DNA binding protein
MAQNKPVERPQPLAVSIEEAARLIGTSTGHFRKFIKDGSIRSFRLGARVLVSRRDLERLVQGEAPAMSTTPIR